MFLAAAPALLAQSLFVPEHLSIALDSQLNADACLAKQPKPRASKPEVLEFQIYKSTSGTWTGRSALCVPLFVNFSKGMMRKSSAALIHEVETAVAKWGKSQFSQGEEKHFSSHLGLMVQCEFANPRVFSLSPAPAHFFVMCWVRFPTSYGSNQHDAEPPFKRLWSWPGHTQIDTGTTLTGATAKLAFSEAPAHETPDQEPLLFVTRWRFPPTHSRHPLARLCDDGGLPIKLCQTWNRNEVAATPWCGAVFSSLIDPKSLKQIPEGSTQEKSPLSTQRWRLSGHILWQSFPHGRSETLVDVPPKTLTTWKGTFNRNPVSFRSRCLPPPRHAPALWAPEPH